MKGADIAFVIGSMRFGGAERATLHLMNGLVERGWNIELVLLHNSGELLPALDSRISVVSLNKRKAIHGVNIFKKYLNEHSPARVFAVQNHIQLMVLLAVIFSRWKGKVILNEQSTFRKNLKGLKGMLQQILSKLLFTKADAIVAVSEGSASELKKVFRSLAEKIHVIYNPVITDEFLKIRDLEVQHPFFSGNTQVIISAGRLVRSKNFELLIRAFSKVKERIDARLIILGEGEERENLILLVERLHLNYAVSLPGFVAEPCRYFSKSDVFVLSSDYEGLPGVLIEALACGCKIVSTDCESGPSEILDNGNFGWLCPVGNIDVMADKIEVALRSLADKSKLMRRADDFHERKIVAEYIKLFNSLR